MIRGYISSLTSLFAISCVAAAACGDLEKSVIKSCGKSFCIRGLATVHLRPIMQQEDFNTYRISGLAEPVVIYEGSNPSDDELAKLVRSQTFLISSIPAKIFRRGENVEVRIELDSKIWPQYLVLYSKCLSEVDCPAVRIAENLVSAK